MLMWIIFVIICHRVFLKALANSLFLEDLLCNVPARVCVCVLKHKLVNVFPVCASPKVCALTHSFPWVKNLPFDVWQRERVRKTGEERGGDRQMWERDLERLLTLHQAQGKSNQAISKPRRSAAATLAPHNYNTIWQRYWAQIPCYFCGCVYPARTWFYIKVPKMALTLTYWKERPWSKAERANAVRMCRLSRVQERQHRTRERRSSSSLRWKACFWKGDLYLHSTSWKAQWWPYTGWRKRATFVKEGWMRKRQIAVLSLQ